MTINIPIAYIEAIQGLCGTDDEYALYTSRSELVREAIRRALVKEVSYEKLKRVEVEMEMVRVPISKEKPEELTNYKILRRLEL